MGDLSKTACQRNCWWIAAFGGLVLAAVLHFAAQMAVGPSLFFGLILFAFLGYLLGWVMCSGAGDQAALPADQPPPAPPTPPRAIETVTPRPDPTRAPASMAEDTPKAVTKTEIPAQAVSVTATPKPRTAKPKAPATPKARAAPTVKTAAKPAATKAPKASGLGVAMERNKERRLGEPELLLAPRGGVSDDLKLIVGVGPALEKLLNSVGVWHFDQIASWKAKDIAFVDGKMANFKGRITRDEWVKQARALAAGKKPDAGAKA